MSLVNRPLKRCECFESSTTWKEQSIIESPSHCILEPDVLLSDTTIAGFCFPMQRGCMDWIPEVSCQCPLLLCDTGLYPVSDIRTAAQNTTIPQHPKLHLLLDWHTQLCLPFPTVFIVLPSLGIMLQPSFFSVPPPLPQMKSSFSQRPLVQSQRWVDSWSWADSVTEFLPSLLVEYQKPQQRKRYHSECWKREISWICGKAWGEQDLWTDRRYWVAHPTDQGGREISVS